MENNKLIDYFLFPYNVLKKDKLLFFWIFAALAGGSFTIISNFFLSNKINNEFSQGTFYIFSIALIIPVIADIIIYLISEQRIIDADNTFKSSKVQKELPILKTVSIKNYLLVILIINIIILIFSIMLYSGVNKRCWWLQIILLIVSFYLTFYHYCLNRISQYPETYEDFMETQKEDIQDIIDEKSESFYSSEGKEVKLDD